MKKLAILILLFTGYVYSQQVEPIIHDTTAGGAYLPSGIKLLGTKKDATHTLMPVTGIVTATVSGVSTAVRQDTLLPVVKGIRTNTAAISASENILQGYLHPANKFGGTNGLKSITAVDSTVIYTGVTTWQRTSIVALDTVEFSYTAAFTVKQLLLPYEIWTDPVPISIASATKLYIRSYGSSTTRKVKISYIGY